MDGSEEWDKLRFLREQYFDKRIFRFGLLIFVVLLLIVGFQRGWDLDPKPSVTCERSVSCINPYYYCKNSPVENSNGWGQEVSYDCPMIQRFLSTQRFKSEWCVGGLCDVKHVMPGETVGYVPSYLERNVLGFGFYILLVCFLVNHLLYRKKQRSDG